MTIRILCLTALVFVLNVNYGFAQKTTTDSNITKANSFYADYIKSITLRNIDTLALYKARQYINTSLKSNVSMEDAKTWFVKGNIELAFVNAVGLKMEHIDATEKTIGSFTKCLELDAYRKYTDDAIQNLKALTSYLYTNGTNKYNKNKYKDAYNYFSKIIEVNNLVKRFAIKNDNVLYQKKEQIDLPTYEAAAYSALNCGKADEALNYFRILYLNESKSYGNMRNYALLLKKQGDIEKYETITKETKKLFPNIKNILTDDIIALVNSGNTKVAIEKALEALKTEPENEKLYFVLATAYEAEQKYTSAVSAYENAIKFDENYFDANYNLGVIYYNEGIEKIKSILAINEKDRTAMLIQKEKRALIALYTKALPYFEKAHGLKSGDRNTILALKEIYTKLGKKSSLLSE